MCDFSGNLIAWMDGELPQGEAADVEKHVAVCSECRSGLDAFRRISIAFDAHCDEVMDSMEDPGRRTVSWVPVLSAAVAVTAAVALFLVWPRTRVQPPAFHSPQVVERSVQVAGAKKLSASIRPIEKLHTRRAPPPKQSLVRVVQDEDANSAPAQSENLYVSSNERVVQIAIPADEMFPPGAMPQGMQFVADLTIAADGSAERLRLRPRLAEFERRTTLP